MLATDIGDRWLFRYRPGMGPAVEGAVGILGVEMALDPGGWSVTWATAEAPIP